MSKQYQLKITLTDPDGHADTDMAKHIIYECGICDCYHPWNWNGDCRNDTNRYDSVEDYLEAKGIKEFNDAGELQLEVRSMDDRVAADLGEDNDTDEHDTDTQGLCCR